MKKKNRRTICIAIGFLAAFILWTAAVTQIDVRPIGPNGSTVGFAALNSLVHDLTGVHMSLYAITDWLGLVPLGFVLGFGILGLAQWIGRKNLLEVDRSILILGGFYIVVLAAYVLFELYPVNYRPVLIEGVLEASYPSSTTMLVLTVMPTVIMQLRRRLRNPVCRRIVVSAIIVFLIAMVAGRLASGVHWFTDVVGGALLSAGLVMLYGFFVG